MKLVFGNIDYRLHMTNEGDQLQLGLQHAGWKIVGAGYEDDCRDVPKLLAAYNPELLFVQDKRDWSPECPGSFRKDIGFENLSALRERHDIFKICVLKDAGSVSGFHHKFFEETAADAGLIYYHPDIVRRLNPWLGSLRLLRTYHSVDRDVCDGLDFPSATERGQLPIISGAVSQIYPLRSLIIKAAARHPNYGIRVVGHPGYNNRGCHTNDYLHMLSKQKVHIATASRFGFALRKIIESVAMGCVPVTNLPKEDVLPEIDGALIRIKPNERFNDILIAARRAEREWNYEERLAWAMKARAFYDYRALGARLDALISKARP